MVKTAFVSAAAIALLGFVLALVLVDEGKPAAGKIRDTSAETGLSAPQPQNGARVPNVRLRCTPDLSCAIIRSDVAALQ